MSEAGDIFFRNARSIPRFEAEPRNTVREYVVYNQGGDRWTRVPGVVGLEVTFRDWSGGDAKYQGPFSQVSNRTSGSFGLDKTHPGYLMLAQRTVSQASPDPTGDLLGIHWVNCFGVLLIGIGSGNDVSFYKETSASDATLAAITGVGTAGRPGSSITGLWKGQAGAAAIDERVFMGRVGANTLVVGDAAGTIDATMHNDTNTTWGMCFTSLPHTSGGRVILMQIDNGMYTLSSTETITNAPAVVTGITCNAGGFGGWEMSLNGAPNRAYFAHPVEDTTAGALKYGTEVKCHAWHYSLEGDDQDRLILNELPNGFYQMAPCNSPVYGQGFLFTDGVVSVFHNGSLEVNLNQFTEDYPADENFTFDSDVYMRCRGFAVQNGGEVSARIEAIDSTGTAETETQMWKLDWHTLTWSVNERSSTVATGNTVKSVLAAGGWPVSQTTKNWHMYYPTDGNWERQVLLYSGENPYFLYRNTAGATSTTGNLFAAQGDLETPFLDLGLPPGTPMVPESISMRGEIFQAGTNAHVFIEVYQQDTVAASATAGEPGALLRSGMIANSLFVAGNKGPDTNRLNAYYQYFPNNTDFSYDLKLHVQLSCDEQRRTPVVFSITVRLLCFLNGESAIRSPAEVTGV